MQSNSIFISKLIFRQFVTILPCLMAKSKLGKFDKIIGASLVGAFFVVGAKEQIYAKEIRIYEKIRCN